MREIKFRAYDEKSKRMFNVDVLAISPVMWDSGGTGVSLAYQPHIKVMQFTGLYDKHHKQIYEGDIVEVKSIFSNKNERYVVEYSEYSEWVIGMFLLSKRFQSCEVIGNICENPELLEESP